MKAFFIICFILLFLQTESTMSLQTGDIDNTTESSENAQKLNNKFPTFSGGPSVNMTEGADTNATAKTSNTTASDFGAPTLVMANTTATERTSPVDIIPTIDPFDYFLTATCCTLRRCPSTMGCIDYEDRWGCSCVLSQRQKIQRMEIARAVMQRMGIKRYSVPYNGDEN